MAYGDIVLTIVLIMSMLVVWYSKRIHNRIRLAEYKHIATIYAMELEFKNGFTTAYREKLEELIDEHKFKVKGE